MDLDVFPGSLLSLKQRLVVPLEVDNLMIAIILAVQQAVFVFELVQPKSVLRKTKRIFDFHLKCTSNVKSCKLYYTSTDFVRSISSILIRTSPIASFCEYRSQSITCIINSLPGNWSRETGNLKCWSKYGWCSPRAINASRLRLSTSGASVKRTSGSRKPPSSIGHKPCAMSRKIEF